MRWAMLLLLALLLSGCDYRVYFEQPSISEYNATHDVLNYTIVNENRIKQNCEIVMELDDGVNISTVTSQPICVDAKGRLEGQTYFQMPEGETNMTARLECSGP